MKVASNPSMGDELNQMSLMIFKKPLSELTDDEYEDLQEYIREKSAKGGIAGSNGGSMLVTPTKDGSRPGYYGPDAGFGDDDYKDAAADFAAKGGGDGPQGPPSIINPPPKNVGNDQKKPIINFTNPFKNLSTHFANNQKLKNAVKLGLITNDEYNTLGGYDVNKTIGLDPFSTGVTSALYNTYQTLTGDQKVSDIYGDVKRNVEGSFGLPEELQTKYDNIMSMSSDEMTDQLANQKIAQMANGGRIGLKDGLLAKMMPSVKPDGGLFKSIFANRNAPFISGFNTAELFDLVSQISSLPGLAEGGRIGYKDGPKNPKRRSFMKAAVGIASMLPFGIGKGVKMAAPVINKASEITAPMLNKIIETVMSAGKLISLKGRKVKEMVTKKKLKDIEVEEDIMDGSYTIKKGNKEIYYRPGKTDEMGIEEDIIEVIEKSVKKSSGGVARMLGE